MQTSQPPIPKQILTERARDLRQSSTAAERFIWRNLRNHNLGCKFRRQYVINSYIVDFVCVSLRLIIEIDGGQHMNQRKYDRLRTFKLAQLGYKVLRFWNNEVRNHPKGVITQIYREIQLRKKLFGIDEDFIKDEGEGYTDIYYL